MGTEGDEEVLHVLMGDRLASDTCPTGGCGLGLIGGEAGAHMRAEGWHGMCAQH